MPLNFLHPFGFICRFPPLWPLHNFLRLCCINFRISPAPCASQQPPACIWFQYLGFPCLSTTSCAHLVSISNFPSQGWCFLKFLHSLGFNIYILQGVRRPPPCDALGFPPPSHSALFFSISTLHTSAPHFGAFIWLQYLNFPPVCLSAFPAFIHLVSRLPLSSLDNFLHASQLGFNV